MGLDDPTAKMSKSEASDYHAIYLLDTPSRVKEVDYAGGNRLILGNSI